MWTGFLPESFKAMASARQSPERGQKKCKPESGAAEPVLGGLAYFFFWGRYFFSIEATTT